MHDNYVVCSNINCRVLDNLSLLIFIWVVPHSSLRSNTTSSKKLSLTTWPALLNQIFVFIFKYLLIFSCMFTYFHGFPSLEYKYFQVEPFHLVDCFKNIPWCLETIYSLNEKNIHKWYNLKFFFFNWRLYFFQNSYLI